MIKYLLIFANAFSLFFYNLFFSADTNVTARFPTQVAPGSEFVAEMIIKRGGISGFAKLGLTVDPAFTVSEMDVKGGSFSFENGSVKLIWTSVPSDEEFTVKLKFNVAADASGDKPVTGKFSYVENGEKKIVEITEIKIKVGADQVATTPAPVTETPVAKAPETTTPEPVVPATTTPEPIATTPSTTPAPAAGSTGITTAKSADGSIVLTRTMKRVDAETQLVTVKIKKGPIKGFSKYQETLPAGYQAVGEKVNGGTASQAGTKFKIVWISTPAADEFESTYKLVGKGDGNIEGELSYLESGNQAKLKLDPTSVIGGGTAAEPVASTPEPVKTTPEPVKTPEPVAATPEPVKTTPEPVKAAEPEPAKTTISTPAPSNSNVNYAVQIAAMQTSIDANKMAAIFKINDNVRTEMQDGFTKYVLGNFGEYKQARDKRNTVRATAKHAFVTAYNSGKRITVQEALMITNQKWFK